MPLTIPAWGGWEALLNSKLLDWYFRLGSTNSKVNEYQFNNLPCPVFGESDLAQKVRIIGQIEEGRLDNAFDMIAPALQVFPVSAGVADVIEAATLRIVDIEWKRGNVSKRERAFLSEEAEEYQRFIDRVIFAIAGLSAHEASELQHRLKRMM